METIPKVQVIKNPSDSGSAPVSRYPVSLRLVRFGFSTFGRLIPGLAGRVAYRLFSTPRKRAKHRVSDAVLEQAQVFEFLYGGQLLKGYQWGKGPRTILLVHGWESRGTALRSFVPSLLQLGYRVVAFDGPAHGNSGGKQTNLPHFGGAVRAIIHRLGGVYGIIAHSFGGASTVFTLANLDNSIAVKRLVMIASPSNMQQVLNDFLEMVRAPQSVRKSFWNIISSKLEVDIEEAEVSKLASRAKVDQLLIIHDRGDKVVPFSEGKTIADLWPNGQLLITEGWGHFQLMKAQPVIQKVVAFISE